MSKDKLLDWIVLLLVAVGLVVLGEQLISLSSSQALKLLTKGVQYASLPVGLAIKLFKWISSERDKLDKLLQEVREIALTNRGNDESLKEQLRFIRDDFISSRVEFQESALSLDRRMIRLEARSELATKLENHETRLNELTDRFNQSLI